METLSDVWGIISTVAFDFLYMYRSRKMFRHFTRMGDLTVIVDQPGSLIGDAISGKE
jgi:hypothetical protein